MVAGATLMGTGLRVKAAGTFPAGLIYAKEAPGRWAGKEGAHGPKVTVEGRSIATHQSCDMKNYLYLALGC
jgi:hypothetical protein